MLERIEVIQGVGLLHQANGKSYTCHKATLIYADNGRGKSTLATLFRSVATGNAGLISARKTLDGTLPQKAILQFGSGHRVTFENEVWSEKRPELLVFDSDFIERNVHSGGAVNTDHRKNLLEFALGEEAVAARAAVEKATNDSKVATENIQSIVGQLSGYHPGLTLAQFEQLPEIKDIDKHLVELQKRLSAASNVAAIQAKPLPKVVAVPTFDLESLFGGLSLSLQDVHADAEKLVKQHVAKLGGKGAESWLTQGQHFSDGSTCPFCDQDISRGALVLAYQTYFNAAYGDLKAKLAVLQSAVVAGTAENIVDSFEKSVGVAIAQVNAWVEQIQTVAITFDAVAARTPLAAFRQLVEDLVKRKNTNPADPIGTTEQKAKAVRLWDQVMAPFRSTNAAITAAVALIGGYKAQLSSDSTPQLQQQIQRLQATKWRYEIKVIELVGKLAVSRRSVESADNTKKAARDALDNLMSSTLNKYQETINSLLESFGASFSIKDMSANFRGNAPRSEYGLLLRGKAVALEGGPPSFATALSDGDKRTLAFAFFIASILKDPKLAIRTVVVDDPMCSLDWNRRHHTRAVLKKLHAKAAQLIVLAHDSYFLRDLRDALRKEDKTTSIANFQLAAAPNDYTDFAAFDIDKECESPYSRHHRLLNEFSAGLGGDPTTVAKAIRPMIEGYLHRRFSGLVPKDLLFGQMVVLVRDSVPPNPLSHAKNLVDELNEINDYAGQFHHDTNPDADTAVVTDSELKTYVDRALIVVHKGAPL